MNIIENYHDPNHPTAFSGINTIYKFYNGSISKKKIRDLLKHSFSYSIHRETKKRYRNPYMVYFKRQQFQIDLVDIKELHKENDGYKYLLTCIDVFTKKAFVRPCKSKKASEILTQFKSILNEAGKYPRTLLSDKGSEIKNRLFNKFCKDNNIKQIFPETEVHASVVERFNKTIQVILYKYLSQNETLRYIDKLQNFVNSYNTRYHRSIKMTPNQGEKKINHPKIFREIDRKIKQLFKKKGSPKFKVGDYVRVKPLRRTFRRAYDQQFTEEIFEITEIKSNLPVLMYKIKDLNNEDIIGSFYEDELSHTIKPDEFKIDKVLMRKVVNGIPMAFVSWKGYGKDFNQWIRDTDIVELKK
jgi:hypothetical protein